MAIFGNVVQEYYVKKFRENLAIRQKRLRSLDSKEAAQEYVNEVKARIRSAYAFPKEKSPLNPRITGTLKGAGFSVEKIIFESRPGFLVTGNLYIPDDLTAPAPAVLFVCGHSENGKCADTYQLAMQSFALNGYVVFGIDPFGQGERMQFPEDTGISVCNEHNVCNRRMLPAGDCTGAWRIWDAIRAVDYMLTRKEIDPARIAVNGNSGGGTMTSLIFAVEDRISMACPNCYITTWMRNVENELPVDAEQVPENAAVNGGEMVDLLIAAAPKPVLIGGQKNDFFDLRGTREAYLQVKKVYDLLGYGDRVDFQYGPCSHGYSIHLRENACRFFCKHMGLPEFKGESPDLKVFPDKDLYCTPAGKVVDMPENRTIHEFIAEKVEEAVNARPALDEDTLRSKLADMLKIDKNLPAAPYYRQLRVRWQNKRPFSRFLMETEPDMLITMHLADADNYHFPTLKEAELYIPHQDAEAEMAELQQTADVPLFGVDYRGVGESCPNGCDQYEVRNFFAAYEYDYHFASLGLFLGKPYLGGRVFDVLNAIALLKQHGAEKITLRCSGIGRIVALLAAFIAKVNYAPDEDLPTCAAASLDMLGPIPQSMTVPRFLELTDFDELAEIVKNHK